MHDQSKVSFMFGEFRDKGTEISYLEYERENAIRAIKPALIIFCVVFLLLIIYEYTSFSDNPAISVIAFIRVADMIAAIFLIICLRHIKNAMKINLLLFLFLLIIVVSLIAIFNLFQSGNFLLKTLAIVALLVITFILPGRWVYSVIISIFAIGAFSLFTFINVGELQSFLTESEIYFAFSYTVIISAFGTLYSYKENKQKRLKYLKTMELERLSSTDPLTGLMNRRKFDIELDKWMKLKKRYKIDLSLMLFDIDDFKAKNDEYGHMEGDKFIKEFASCVSRFTRETDTFARWGGDEFSIILPNTNARQAVNLAKRIKENVNGFVFSRGGTITCSFGVAQAEAEEDPETLMQKTDNLLYLAKKNGKNMIMSEEPV